MAKNPVARYIMLCEDNGFVIYDNKNHPHPVRALHPYTCILDTFPPIFNTQCHKRTLKLYVYSRGTYYDR